MDKSRDYKEWLLSCWVPWFLSNRQEPSNSATMILGIETSCDETSVALLDGDGSVRVNLIASQIERHRPFGGVVPEIASREHLQHLFPLVSRALEDAQASWGDVEKIAVTTGPGLIGALLVGVAGAQGLSYALGVPLIAVNTLERHLYSPYRRLEGDPKTLPDFCATFQEALFAQLFDRLDAVWSRLEPPLPTEVAMAGGVAANGALREKIVAWGGRRGVIIRLPEKVFCTDNAA